MPIRNGIDISEEDAIAYDRLMDEAAYADRLQYIYKIKLNSYFGGLSNKFFRFFDLRVGESITGTGRFILRHQCRKVNELLGGEYDIDFPLYETVAEAIEHGHPAETALHGPVFNGKHPAEAVVYGDSVSGDALISTARGDYAIQDLFKEVEAEDLLQGKEYYHPLDLVVACYDELNGCVRYRPVKYIMRHRANKQMYRVHDSTGNSVDVTEDHSMLVVKRPRRHYWALEEVRPQDLMELDTRYENWFVVRNNDNIGFQFSSVTKVEPIEYNGYVYDIEVDEHHNFFANNILVHNTDSTYFRTYAENPEEAIQIADIIGEKVNRSYPEFMREMFLCNPGYDNLVKCAREIVSSNGIFVKKKRYVLHIIDKEGKKQDKLKVMGLDTVRTTTPKFIAEKINDFIGRYLKGESWDVIAKEIVDFKDQLLRPDNIIQIGLPKGVSKVEQYTQAYQLNKDTNLPGHIAASIFYNIQRALNNDNESPSITSGMKIKVFWLKKPIGRFKSIALPGDLTQPPKWFSEFVIDVDAHIEKLVDNPLNNIINAIGKVAPSKQTLLEDDLLVFC